MVSVLSCWFSNLVPILPFKGNAYVYIHFLNHKLFEKSLHAFAFCFSIAKGLATFRLGGDVISAQKVLCLALFEIGFECFLRTNHIN